MYAQFTILGTPTVKGDVAHPMLTMTLDEAEQSLLSAIKNESFTVYYAIDGKVRESCYIRLLQVALYNCLMRCTMTFIMLVENCHTSLPYIVPQLPRNSSAT